MAQPPESPESPASAPPPERRSPLATNPVTSLVIAVLMIATIGFTLYVPIYARLTPRVGDFPFFYFYLLVYMPAAAIALWVVARLQRQLPSHRASQGGGQR
jgi:membrane protein implicated in regulation of membrane protease activity